MRPWSLAVALIALAGPAAAQQAAAQPPAIAPSAACSAAASVPAKETAPPPIRRLDQLPPGRLELAVLRTIGGCNVASVKQGDRIIYLPAPTATPRPVPAAHAR